MMQYILGSTEAYPALAFVALMFGFTVVTTSLIVKRRSATELHNEFELKKLEFRLNDEKTKRQTALDRDISLGKIAANREIEFKRIDTEGVINVTGGKRVAVEDE